MPDSKTHGLLAFDEVYVSSSTLRPSTTPSTAVLQQQDPITAVFLHGLLGSNKNWRSFTRKLAVEAAAKANRDVRVLLLDLRCHGDTASRYGFHPPHDMAAAAADVSAIIQHELQGQAPHVLAGLSLGGKVALQVLKHLVTAQEEAQHTQQHLYQPAPPILPPADAAAASSSSSTGAQPALRGVPQQVGTPPR
jgi:predicted alpha/beta-fold hydrolase